MQPRFINTANASRNQARTCPFFCNKNRLLWYSYSALIYLSSLLGIIKKTITKSPLYSHSNRILCWPWPDHIHTERCNDPYPGIHLYIAANSQFCLFVHFRMHNAVFCWLVLHADAEIGHLARADFDQTWRCQCYMLDRLEPQRELRILELF